MAEYKTQKPDWFHVTQTDNGGKNIALFAPDALKIITENR
jgi:hypothetical protein